jgi:hypothetical protein
MAEQIS